MDKERVVNLKTLRAIEQAERFIYKPPQPLNEMRKVEGLPETTLEAVLAGRRKQLDEFMRTHPMISPNQSRRG